MLIVVKYRNIALFDQRPFNFKAARRADILQIDSAKTLGNIVHGIDNHLRIFGIDTNRYGVNARKCFEQRALSLHDRHSRRRPYVAQAQNRGSVSNHRYRISLSSIRIRQALVSLDLQAGFRYPRRISDGQLLPVGDGRLGLYRKLSPPFCVFGKCQFPFIHCRFLSFPVLMIYFQSERLSSHSVPSLICRLTSLGAVPP